MSVSSHACTHLTLLDYSIWVLTEKQTKRCVYAALLPLGVVSQVCLILIMASLVCLAAKVHVESVLLIMLCCTATFGYAPVVSHYLVHNTFQSLHEAVTLLHKIYKLSVNC